MSLRSYTTIRHVLTPRHRRSTARLPRVHFSRWTAWQQEAKEQSRTRIDATWHPSIEQNEHGRRTEPSRRGLPALAISLVAFPLGWWLSTHYSHGRDGITYANPNEFVAYTLVSKNPISSTASIFCLRPASRTQLDLDNPELERAVTSVQFKQPQLQIARAYTTLPHADGQALDEVRFLIRRERSGEVSNFLHRLPLGAQIELRGLRVEYVVPATTAKVLFLAGGTGIAPAMQTLDLLEESADVRVLWASRVREDCKGGVSDTAAAPSHASNWWPQWGRADPIAAQTPSGNVDKNEIVRQIDSLKRQSPASKPGNRRVLVDYFADEEGSFIRPAHVQTALASLQTPSERNDVTGKILFVSGPEGFVNYWAGPKQWVNGREEQGPLGGILASLDLHGWKVIKL